METYQELPNIRVQSLGPDHIAVSLRKATLVPDIIRPVLTTAGGRQPRKLGPHLQDAGRDEGEGRHDDEVGHDVLVVQIRLLEDVGQGLEQRAGLCLVGVEALLEPLQVRPDGGGDVFDDADEPREGGDVLLHLEWVAGVCVLGEGCVSELCFMRLELFASEQAGLFLFTYSRDDQSCPETFRRVVVFSREEGHPCEDRSLLDRLCQDGIVNLGRLYVADVSGER